MASLVSQKLCELRRRLSESGDSSPNFAESPTAALLKRSFSLGETVLGVHGFPRSVVASSALRPFDVHVRLPDGSTKKLHGENDITVKELTQELVEEYNWTNFTMELLNPPVPLDMDAKAVDLDGETIVIEEVVTDPRTESDARLRIITDLWKSEKECQKLYRSVQELYGDPLRKFSSLSLEDYRVLFVSVEPITSISAMMCSKLERVVNGWESTSSCVGNLFSNKFWQHYQEYYLSYRIIRTLLRHKKDSDTEFVEFCRLRQGATKHSLDSLLFLPVQRIPEYDKYLSDLLSETQENHPDYDDLRKAASKVKNMVKDREEEVNVVENEYKVERVQDLFPNDDLQLREKESKKNKLLQRRRSAPSAVLLKSLGSARIKVGAVGGTGDSSSLPRLNNSVNRLYITEGPVQLAVALQKQDRYLFLFNDLLLIAKQKSNTTFKLKHRIRVCEMWMSECLDDVCELSKTPEKSFVIGWPTANMVATFSTPELKDQWMAKLKSQINEEKSKEVPETVLFKVINKDMEDAAKTKSFPIGKTCDALECIQRCIEEFEIQEGDAKDFQLWVVSGKEDSPYPLIGHEHPYSIKMSHIRDQSRQDCDGVVSAQDTDTSPDKMFDRNYQCQFVLKHSKKPLKKLSLDESGTQKKVKKQKKSPLINLFKKSSSKLDTLSPLSPITTGKLFGHSLSEVCSEEGLPKPILELLHCLFHMGPFTPGIFRKSANARVCKEIKEKLDYGDVDCSLAEETSVLVHGATLKDFLRSLPDSLLECDLYEQWTETNDIEDRAERIQAIKSLLDRIPAENLDLLRQFMCILYHIDQKSDENNMNAYNLAICVGPSLLWPHLSAGTATQTMASKRVPVLVQFFIDNCEDILGEDCTKIFGELNEQKVRQDSSTDSDSMHSILSMQDAAGMMNNKESSLDSLECNEFLSCSEMESSPKMTKSHLSPTNLSRDSGLTLSDSQLFDDDAESDCLFTDIKQVYNRSISQRDDRSAQKVETGPHSNSFEHVNDGIHQQSNPVPPPRKGKTRRGSEPPQMLDVQNHHSYRLMQSQSGANLFTRQPERQQGLPFSNSANADLMRNMRCNMPQKRVSNDSDLGSLDEDSSIHDYYMQRAQRQEMGIITKSASGSHLYIDEELFSANADSKVHQSRIQERMRRQSSHETPPTSPLSGYSYSSQESLASETTPPPCHRIFRRNKGRAPSPPQQNTLYEGRRSSDPSSQSEDQIDSGSTNHRLHTSIFRQKSASAPSSPEHNSPVNSPRTVSPDQIVPDMTRRSSNKTVPEIKLPEDTVFTPPPLPPKGHLTLSMAAQRNSMPVRPFYDPNLGSPPPQVVLRNKLSSSEQKSRSLPRTRGSEMSPLRDMSLTPVRPGLMKRNTYHGSLSPRLNALDNSLSSVRIPEEQISSATISRSESCRMDNKPHHSRNEDAYSLEKSASDSSVAFTLQDLSENEVDASLSHDVQMRRPANPPSYNEAIERKSLIESGASEIERIRQTVKSARARELFEKSQKQYERQHNDSPLEKSNGKISPPCVDVNSNIHRKTLSDSVNDNLTVAPSNQTVLLHRSKSDSCEHINKIVHMNIKHLKPVQINTTHWRQASPDRRPTANEDDDRSNVERSAQDVHRRKHLPDQHPLFYLPQNSNKEGSISRNGSREPSVGRNSSKSSSVSRESSISRHSSPSPAISRKHSPGQTLSNSAENSSSRKRHSPSVSRENSLKSVGNDENSPPNSKKSEINWSVAQMKNMFDLQKDGENRQSPVRESTPPASATRRREPPPYRPPPDINAHYATEKNSPRVSPSKQIDSKETISKTGPKNVKDCFFSGEQVNGLRMSKETAAEIAKTCHPKQESRERSLEESLKFSEESYV